MEGGCSSREAWLRLLLPWVDLDVLKSVMVMMMILPVW